MKPGSYVVILVPSTSYALRAERVLHKAGVDCKLIPVPRSLSSDCGVCLRIAAEDQERASQSLEEADLPVEGIHPIHSLT